METGARFALASYAANLSIHEDHSRERMDRNVFRNRSLGKDFLTELGSQKEPVGLIGGGAMSDVNILLVGGSCLSLILMAHMWIWRKGQRHWKVYWTMMLFFIYIGPLFYLIFYDPPSRKSLQQLEAESIFSYWRL